MLIEQFILKKHVQVIKKIKVILSNVLKDMLNQTCKTRQKKLC